MYIHDSKDTNQEQNDKTPFTVVETQKQTTLNINHTLSE